MVNLRNFLRASALCAAVAMLSACAPNSYIVKTPSPSGMQHAAPSVPQAILTLSDARAKDDLILVRGIFSPQLMADGAAIDAPAFLAKHLQAELVSRGLPVSVSQGSTGDPLTALKSFYLLTHRASGFSPFVTLTFLSADVSSGGATQRLGVFIKRGKVPVWSFDEIIDPTLNQPLSLAVKELASKLARTLYRSQATDTAVDALLAKLNGPRTGESYLDVYALGFSNHPKVLPRLVELSKDADEYVRLAAISSIGIVGDASQLDYLKTLYQSSTGLWQDRGMALKAIGDLNTDASRAFLTEEKKRWEAQTGDDAKWYLQIIKLYL